MSKPGKKNQSHPSATIAVNRKAKHDYTIERNFEAGIVLQGWEVKSIRQGRLQLKEGYVILKHDEVWLIGVNITPLASASTHVKPDPTRTRKLLLHRKEISTLIGLVEQKGYTLVPLTLYWKKNQIKLDIGLAKGKKKFDKRVAEKNKDWTRQKQRLMKENR